MWPASWLSWICVRLMIRRLRVWPPPGQQQSFVEIWSWNIFYGHSLPSADSRRAVFSFWRKNLHNTGEPLRRLKSAQKKVWLGKLTVSTWPCWVDWALKPQHKQKHVDVSRNCWMSGKQCIPWSHSAASDLGLHCLLKPVCPSSKN